MIILKMYLAAVRTEWIARSYFLIVQGSSDTGSNLFPRFEIKKKKKRKKERKTNSMLACYDTQASERNWPLQKMPQHSIILLVTQSKILHKYCLQFLLQLRWPQEKLKTMLMQNFGVTNKEYYGMLWYFL